MKSILSNITIATLLISGGCALITSNDTLDRVASDSSLAYSVTSFNYSGYDRSGHQIVEGRLNIYFPDSVTVRGMWDFSATGSSTDIGPQVGKGMLEGTALGDTLFLNLNPGFADNNVILSGVLHGGDFSGTWSWVGFPGVLNQGTFHATMPLGGSWTWVKSAGGIAFHESFPPPSQTIVFGAKDSFSLYRGDNLTASTTYDVRREVTFFSQDTVNVIHFADSIQFVSQAYFITADTLFLNDLCLDCYAHVYVRKR